MAGQLQLEEKLETGWNTLLTANAYITAQSITVKNWHDASVTRGVQNQVVIHIRPVVNEFPNSTLYMADCEIHAVTYSANDKDLTDLTDLYQACLYTLQNATNATLGTAASLTVNGITLLESGEEFLEDDEAYQAFIINFQCHIQA
jgi:hypothetical protein